MTGREYEIEYTKVADKLFRKHEDIRDEYEGSIRELLVGEHSERVDVKRIRGKRSVYYRIRLGTVRVVYAIINGKVIAMAELAWDRQNTVHNRITG